MHRLGGAVRVAPRCPEQQRVMWPRCGAAVLAAVLCQIPAGPVAGPVAGQAASACQTKAAAVIAWFEIPVTDLARASRFYEAVFGFALTPDRVDGYDVALFPGDAAP